MRRKRPGRCECLLLAMFVSTAGAFAAEIVCQEPQDSSDRDCLYLLLAGITEEPDPINMAGSPSGVIPDDAAFVDDTPLVVTGNGMTVAVWSESRFGNRDILFSEWRPGGWQEQILTFGGSEERDPRAHIAGDGAIYVTWWETEEPRRVRVARRDPVSLQWEQPDALNGMYGSRPSILALDDEVLVAFERRDWAGGQEVVVRSVPRPGGMGASAGAVDVVLARTYREEPLLIQLHAHGDRVFIDWIHCVNFFGYSEYLDRQWGASLDDRPLSQRANAVQVRREVAFGLR